MNDTGVTGCFFFSTSFNCGSSVIDLLRALRDGCGWIGTLLSLGNCFKLRSVSFFLF
jgi:hypothetical protein